MTIVKVQQPLSSSHPNPPWLVYAEGRKDMRWVAATLVPGAVKDAMGEDPKGYFEATLANPQAEWEIGERVEDQDW